MLDATTIKQIDKAGWEWIDNFIGLLIDEINRQGYSKEEIMMLLDTFKTNCKGRIRETDGDLILSKLK